MTATSIARVSARELAEADAIGEDGKIYRLYSWEGITSPEDAIKRAVLKALELGLGKVGVETDQGGDTWRSVYWQACNAVRRERPEYADAIMPAFGSDKAGAGHGAKVERNAGMLASYGGGR